MIRNCFILSLFVFFSCSHNNVRTDDSLQANFKSHQLNGCFALMNNGTGEFTVYNLPRYRDSSYAPLFTFSLVNTLVGLQTGVLKSDSLLQVNNANKEGNGKTILQQVFQNNDEQFFQNLAHGIGKDTMQKWLDSLHYGKVKIKTDIDSFWLNGNLKLTPDEQLGFIKRLYFNQLPFFKLYQELLKSAMVTEKNTIYNFTYLSSTTNLQKLPIDVNPSWIVGWIEENHHPYFFVFHFEAQNALSIKKDSQIQFMKEVLQKIGFFEGKM